MYKPTIGLEIHCELKTKTKMFCGCANDPEERHPNVNICPICTGHPGCLPTINKEAVRKVIKLGMALGSEIPTISKFDRKNYFYPDLPKAYQISQYDQPLVSGGVLRGVRLERVHLEEDTARIAHSSQLTDYPKDAKPASLIDYNRSSMPLMELVTKPDVTSGEQAVAFAKELQMILRYLGISDADMEKGQMRVEANISVSKDETLGTKVEVKNLNSFRAVSDSIDFEIKRQSELLERGEQVVQSTRGWDEKKKETVLQRLKEQAHDYRYFPEPDLPPLDLAHFDLESIREEIVELPQQKRDRLASEYGLNEEQSNILAETPEVAEWFEQAVSEVRALNPEAPAQLVYNYYTTDLRALMKEAGMELGMLRIAPFHFAKVITFVAQGKLNSRLAKDILKEMFDTGADPEEIMQAKGLNEEVSADALHEVIKETIAENPKAIEDYKKGQENALQFLIGKVMGKMKGRANPVELKALFEEILK
ncbi:MAG: Aspartyl/glutamyl-tRNA(Asn/Gln) amidotransferase subunit B [Candidatus Wolfebacteria bacterium GW2011_GWE1_48_7]|uniref:Aspartyl/glutamyl-tRNA(Asn/Gln) amidotransferase subunit B n=2 Tax=Candidatus Wolfeibacteriota TaxID=1752735 RepID=A0A0G1WFY7_9BACT|nr:MAG: glutamyl-tRNA(Gln) and/or aspartyl-tRNA(Asn) amidotransferase, B subunit [Candidatus Wolfebacteria bacterium GW2011_GWB1_47_1]KKU41448.1 MAG: Aspartyl/glutamyl-tRNA(Asn/Gln) amidotransferase subunit B [Candidatus Wolfebacteria bacterium GW2011_GWB2_46_69]KKU65413.1 MAG: Aspartyl/glutamyl-tRNA(Asn/Gln) amidotransferase subunit B [Candidatus Wolfebacteria bacterium GW2011_GWD2_47_17]KKU89238.1 MAG: Aspartyl/glutamyl-tRNA(Asn/Gln) amidotransferase subunit B [Candidatus Wolfebacteria bacteri